ncbi:MAG TPA: ATP-dependent metallopeptidase FtsH/Yme1/Tma family protein, partial [Pirellulales bacterium]
MWDTIPQGTHIKITGRQSPPVPNVRLKSVQTPSQRPQSHCAADFMVWAAACGLPLVTARNVWLRVGLVFEAAKGVFMDNPVSGNGLPPINEPSGPKKDGPGGPLPPRPRMSVSTAWGMVIVLAIVAIVWFSRQGEGRSKIEDYRFFRDQLSQNNIAEVEFNDRVLYGKFKKAPLAPQPAEAEPADANAPKPERLHQEFEVNLPLAEVDNKDLLKEMLDKKVEIKTHIPSENSFLVGFIIYVLPILLMVWLVVLILRRTRDPFLGGGILGGFNKSPAKRYETTRRPITFADVAGLEGVKHDLE